MSGGVRQKFQMTYFTMPNNISSMKYALKTVPGVADVGVPHGDGDGPVTLAPGSGSKIYAHPVDQHQKLKGYGMERSTYRPNWPWSNVDRCAFLLR